MRLYWCPQTRALRILWLLEESGLDYQLVHIDLADEQSRSRPDFLSASPMAKVPALEDGVVKMAESAAIALYIADRYAQTGLAPAIDSPERGKFLYWMFITPGVIEPAMAERFGGWTPNRGQHGWGDFDSMIATFEHGLDRGPWLLGDQFSAADVLVGSSAVFMKMFDVLPDSKVLNAYTERCLARPAYQRALKAEAN